MDGRLLSVSVVLAAAVFGRRSGSALRSLVKGSSEPPFPKALLGSDPEVLPPGLWENEEAEHLSDWHAVSSSDAGGIVLYTPHGTIADFVGFFEGSVDPGMLSSLRDLLGDLTLEVSPRNPIGRNEPLEGWLKLTRGGQRFPVVLALIGGPDPKSLAESVRFHLDRVRS
jgi:hypothetical protein